MHLVVVAQKMAACIVIVPFLNDVPVNVNDTFLDLGFLNLDSAFAFRAVRCKIEHGGEEKAHGTRVQTQLFVIDSSFSSGIESPRE